MKFNQLFLIVIILIVISRSSTHRLKKESPDEFAEEFNTLFKDKKTEITEITGTKFEAQNVLFNSDSVYWFDLRKNYSRVSKFGRINQISFTSSGKGALEGLGLGLLVGFSTGAVIGFVSGNDETGIVRGITHLRGTS